jgi:hypothetical protein
VFPTPSVARTSYVWLPSARPVRERGLVHEANAAPSRRHSNVADSLALNEKLAAALLDGSDGVDENVALGAVASTVQV